MKKFYLAAGLLGLAGLIWSNQFLQPETAPPNKWERLVHKEKGDGPRQDQPGEAAIYFAGLRETPNGENPDLLNLQAQRQVRTRAAIRGAENRPAINFKDIGPGNFGGRIRSIVVSENDPDIILVGSVSGGIWKTTDGGKNWRPTNDFLPNMAVASMYADPDNPDRVFAGTGEGFFNIDAAAGLGMFVSEDFGETWSHLASTINNNFVFVNRITMIPGTDVVLAATRTGIWRSDNLGQTWNQATAPAASSRGYVDLKIDPSNSNRIYGVHYGGGGASRIVVRSEDGGLNFTALGATEGMPTTNLGRIELGIGSDGVIYAAVSSANDRTNGLYRSTAGGNNFAKTPSNFPFIERQGWFDLVCAVDPSNSDRVFMAAVDTSRTTDAGANINRISIWNPGQGQGADFVHADIHNIAFHPTDSDTFWVVCDGGVFKSTDGGDSFRPLNNGLNINQFYGIALSPDAKLATAGSQDNGTFRYAGDDKVWLEWSGGDGGRCAWDQQQPNFVYGERPGGSLFGSNNGGLTQTAISLPAALGTGALFIAPFTIDPNNGDRLIIGTGSLWYTENLRQLGTATFTNVSGSLGRISATGFSPHDGQTAFAGTTAGQLHRTDNLGSGNTFTRIDTGLPSSDVTWIEVDPNDTSNNTLYATFADYAADRVWKSTDGGQSWTSIHGDLPNIPMFCIKADPNDPNRLWLASELGIFTTASTTRGTVTWGHYDYGVAWSRTQEIIWGNDGAIWVGTHGRGMFRGTVEAASASLGVIDDSSCDNDGVIDLDEKVMVPITVHNETGIGLNSVQVTLSSNLPALDITNETMAFGSIGAFGSVTQSFEVTLTSLANCLDTAQLTAAISFAGGNAQSQFTITLGGNPDMQTGTLSEGAEGDTVFITENPAGATGFGQVSTQANTGVNSWGALPEDNVSDKQLISPWLEVGNGSTTLNFSLFYDLEFANGQHWDGAVLELRTEDKDWVDIGEQSTVPYDGRVWENSPLYHRPAWSGAQRSWRDGSVDLGSQYNGQRIQFRFRMASDTGTIAPEHGFWVDDISITNVTWLNGYFCDTEACIDCFFSTVEALAAVRQSVSSGEWPATRSILDYVGMLNNICLP